MTDCCLYLRLSDFRNDSDPDTFASREAKLRELATHQGWTVRRVIVENDMSDGRLRPATAFKRQRVRNPDGTWAVSPSGGPVWRVLRPGFRSVLRDLETGASAAVAAEDLDRMFRDPVDLEDFIDAMQRKRASARSLSGSLSFTSGGTDSEITMARVMVAMAWKSSRDTSRRVADRREVLARAGSFGGGKRLFGYQPDPDAPKGAKTLIVVESEAAELRRAADAVLASRGRESLQAMARDLRERGVPTATGAQWSATALRAVLLKPAVAGLAVHRGKVAGAALWPPILPREQWEAVAAVLTDPTRRTGTSNAPRWLGSGLYLCGACHGTTTVRVTGGRGGAGGYVCRERNHLRRQAAEVDKFVAAVLCARLDRADARDLLTPPAGAGANTTELRAEAARLAEIGKRQARMHALGEITDDEMAAGSGVRQQRLAEIAAQFAQDTAPDPLVEFRDGKPAADVWAGLSLQRRRGVLSVLAEVTLQPAGRNGARMFNPSTVTIASPDGAPWGDPE